MKEQKLLYLHGFNSSPQSHKAELVRAYMQAHGCAGQLICPHIPHVPGEARSFLEQLVEHELNDAKLSYVGSSLGGYYAIYLAEKYGGRAVLINPSIKPYETLMAHLGENRFYFDEGCWEFNQSHIDQLRAMDVAGIQHPENYLVLLQTGDETLDYRQAAEKFSNSQCIIEQGGDHAFTGLERYLPQLIKFCKIACN